MPTPKFVVLRTTLDQIRPWLLETGTRLVADRTWETGAGPIRVAAPVESTNFEGGTGKPIPVFHFVAQWADDAPRLLSTRAGLTLEAIPQEVGWIGLFAIRHLPLLIPLWEELLAEVPDEWREPSPLLSTPTTPHPPEQSAERQRQKSGPKTWNEDIWAFRQVNECGQDYEVTYQAWLTRASNNKERKVLMHPRRAYKNLFKKPRELIPE